MSRFAGLGASTNRPERLAYLVAAGLTTVAGAAGAHRTHVVAKTALAPLLQVSVLRDRKALSGTEVGVLLLATTAAGLGDVLLVGPADGESEEAGRRRLRRGAGAFAVQQLGYSILLARGGARPRPLPTGAVVATLAGLALLDRSKEGGLDPVVTAYGGLLGTTGSLALGAAPAAPGDPRSRIPWGGAAFVASDVMILLREQLLGHRPAARAAAGAFVLVTYALAQRWLVDGLAAP